MAELPKSSHLASAPSVSSTCPLSPSSRANRPREDEPVAKRAKESAASSSTAPATADGEVAKRAKESASSSSSAPAAAPRGLSPLSQVDTSWQLQLHVGCQQAMDLKMEQPINYGVLDGVEGEPYCSRDLIVSGNSSAFDLVKSLLCAFGINSPEYNHANGQGKLGATTVWVKDVLASSANPDNIFSAVGPIAGLSAKAATATASDEGDFGDCCKVTASDLKKVKLAQLLDKPWYDTPVRSSTAGSRSRLMLAINVPERVGHVSQLGGAVETFKRTVYAFNVTCFAIGSKDAMASSAQRLLPRCVGATGQAYSGSKIDWQEGDDDGGVDCLELDELNIKFVNGRKFSCSHRRRSAVASDDSDDSDDDDDHDDPYTIVDWLRQPLYTIEDASDGESGQPHHSGEGRGCAERPSRW